MNSTELKVRNALSAGSMAGKLRLAGDGGREPPTQGSDYRNLLGLFTLFDRMPGMAAISDCEGALLYLNAAGRAMFDLDRGASLAGASILDRYTPQSRDLLRNRVFPTAIAGGIWCGETALTDDRGQSIPLWQVTVFHRDAGPQGGMLSTLAWDISAQKDQERNLLHQATHDALTGLPSRHLVMDRLSQAIDSAQRTADFTAVLMMDVNGFKAINDGYGHETGNQILSELAVRLYSCVRSCDTVGRYGGDEFVFILCELKSAQEVRPVIDRIRNALSTPFIAGERSFSVGASIGIAIHPEHGSDAGGLVQYADQAMYRAKQQRDHQDARRPQEKIGPTVKCNVELIP